MDYSFLLYLIYFSFIFLILRFKGFSVLNGKENFLVVYLGCASVLVFSIVAGGRGVDAGNDTLAYVLTYQWLSDFESAFTVGFEEFGSSELLFWPFSYFFKYIGFSADLWLFVMSFISLSLGFFVYKKIVGRWAEASILIIMLCGSYYILFLANIMRQVLIVPLVIYSLYLFTQGRVLYPILILIFSMFFHLSPIFCLLFPVFLMLPLNLRMSLPIISFSLSFVVGPMLSVLGVGVDGGGVESKLALYFGSGSDIFLENPRTTFNFLILFCIYMYFWFVGGRGNAMSAYIYLLSIICFFSGINELPLRIYPYIFFVIPWLLWEGLVGHAAGKVLFGYKVFLFMLVVILPFLNYSSESFIYTLGW